jgi:putative iron-regulated protein
MESLRASSFITCMGLLTVACGGDDASEEGGLPANAADAVSTYAEIVYSNYQDSLGMAGLLDEAATSLVESPSAATHDAAKQSWLAAREPYLQTEVYRFYGGPIDDETDGPETLINAWPLDEGHIDYVEGAPASGIVNDEQMTINVTTLTSANLNPGETDVATGYHAIEFLLWGQDFNADGPGERPFTDYTDDASAMPNGDRRGQYLTTTSGLLRNHLEQLVDEWSPSPSGNYRAVLEAEPTADALSKILSGMIILSGFELENERLSAALDAQEQEEEHSCFSDNTHRDMIQNIRGMQNVWLGRYATLSGPDLAGTGVRDVIAAGDAALAQSITSQIELSLSRAEALETPFDQEIAPGNAAGNARVEDLIDALSEQTDLLESAFELYGLNRLPDPT